MSAPVDVLAVLDRLIEVYPEAWEQTPEDEAFVASASEARAAVNELLAFAENIATAYSEPLNSMCVCKRLEDRRHWMGDIRRAARAAIARCGVTP